MKKFQKLFVLLILTALLIVPLVGCGSESSSKNSAEVVKPAVPTGIAYTGGNGQVMIGWPAVTGATSYNVYYGTAAGVTTASATKSTGITTNYKTISGLTNGTPYYFTVTAVNDGGESAISSEVSETPAQYNTGLLWPMANLTTHSADSNLVIIDARTLANYTTGHITGAISLPADTFDEYNTAGIVSMLEEDAASVAYKLGALGISKASEILVYGSTVDSYAGRIFWILEYLGAKDVHILDGGYTGWLAAPNTAQSTANTNTATTFTATTEDIKLATKAYVLANYADTTNYTIVDSRNYSDATTNNYVTRHIPNAVSILTSHFTDPTAPNNVLPVTFGIPGSGCTLDITTVNGTGGITGVAVNASGSGYSVGSILMVEGGDHSAMVKVATLSGTGVATVTIAKAGLTYTTGTGSATRDYSSLANVLSANGITAGKTIITHCYVGWRSAQEYFIFRLMGFNVSNYDGSWTEWNADSTDPVAP